MTYPKPASWVLFVSLAALAQQAPPKAPSDGPPTARVNMVIVKEANGKPVKNAEVVLHQVDKGGNIKPEGLELKTHDDGKAEATGIPYGKVRIQVIARGFRTYGDDFVVSQPSLDLTIKLQKPRDQFSIYK